MSYTRVHEAADVTDEIIELAQGINDGWYDDRKIDWTDFLDRIDGKRLEDGSKIDLSEDLGCPAIKKIKAEIRAYRKL